MMGRGKTDKLLFGHQDDDFDIDMGSGGDMAQFETYEQFDVNKRSIEFVNDAKNIIIAICNAAIQIPEEILQTDEGVKINAYLTQLSKVEASNLSILMKQVRIAEHILDSLIRRLDAGGHTSNDIYGIIIQQQKSVFELTMNFSKYARSLPEYFAFVRNDLKLKNPLESKTLQINNQLKANKQLPEAEIEDGVDSYNNSLPIRGTMDLALSVQNSIQSIKDRMNALPNDDVPDFDLAEVHSAED